MAVVVTVVIFLVCLAGFAAAQIKKVSFNIRVIAGLLAGIVFGAILHEVFKAPETAPALAECSRWLRLPGNAYVRLLQMMVIPLIFVSIVCAIINQKSGKDLGKVTALVLAALLGTAAVAGVVGMVTAQAFGLSSAGIEIGQSEESREAYLQQRAKEAAPIETTLVNIIPTNPFHAMTGQSSSSAALSVVLFAALLGLGVLGVRKFAAEQADFFQKIMNSLNEIVVEVVMMIVSLTPFGIFSLMTVTVAGTNYESIIRLALFVGASYTAIIIMFVIHGVIVACLGLSPLTFFRKGMTTLTFAFTSRSSMATLPLTSSTLTDAMGVQSGISNLAASLGTSIGQNGCAAIFPAMLVVMVMAGTGQHITPGFFILTIIVITFASIGIAGVGGGATFAGITVLSALGLPVGIAGLLISVEPLIDMARTALNVSDGMISALVTARLTGELNKEIYNAKTGRLSKQAAA